MNRESGSARSRDESGGNVTMDRMLRARLRGRILPNSRANFPFVRGSGLEDTDAYGRNHFGELHQLSIAFTFSASTVIV